MIRQAILRALDQARQTAPRAGIVLVAGLAAPLADAAPGDLDPTFGDAGRLELPGFGPIWSLDLEDDGDGFVAGGDYYCYWGECTASSFTQPFSKTGALDLDYAHPDLPGTMILDAARRPDGKIVGVGWTRQSRPSTLTVFRLLPDGTPDSAFGEGGLVQFTSDDDVAHSGTAVVLEADGRIVVAGSRASALIVVRLLEDGALDTGFGNGGVVIGPGSAEGARLARTPEGGYRITTLSGAGMAGGSACRIVALTADGTIDQTFGSGGSVYAAPGAGGSIYCQGLAIQPDGRLLVAGHASEGDNPSGLLVRLLPDGSPDDTFAASTVREVMSEATALTVDAGGRVLVAGRGPIDSAGAVVARVNADGALDATWGNGGTTWIHPSSSEAQPATVNVMAEGTDGSLTVAGSHGGFPVPFAARLGGDASAGAAGIVSLTRTRVVASESETQAVVTVRRAGGKAGTVSVEYGTAPGEASQGTDFEGTTGQLTWGDGDTTDREITIPIADDGPTPEGVESLFLAINPVGDAAVGGRSTRVEIAADGAPAGQFSLYPGEEFLREGQVLEMWVERVYYSAGAVSVTVAASGSATEGADYEVSPTVLTWADGQQGSQAIRVTARRDSVRGEQDEQLVLTLTNPSGGAILSTQASTSLMILDAPPQSGGSGGGGRSFGWLSLLGLGAAGLRRIIRAG